MARKNAERRRKLERWEESLMRSTTFSQVSLHFSSSLSVMAYKKHF